MKKRSKNKENKEKKTVTNVVDINPTMSIVTLNVNGLNIPMNRHRFSQWISKQVPSISHLQ